MLYHFIAVACLLQVASLRSDLEGKARQLQSLQAEMKALQAEADGALKGCRAQLAASQERAAALQRELGDERTRAAKVGL
jgi:hypothetical protein